MGKYLIAITGASGSVYGLRTMGALAAGGHEVHAIVSPWGDHVIHEETGRPFSSWIKELGLCRDRVYAPGDLAAGPSSGSFALDGMVIVPCSMNSAGSIASGIAGNLIHRCALVSLKEGRPLILVPRETPLSLLDLRKLTSLAEAGAVILPASPAFYQKPQDIDGLVDFIAGKILSRLGLEQRLFEAWGSPLKNSPWGSEAARGQP
ncbi:MAG: UbiX family flavin prenyltransferase [Spirochaetaceae bacterium]|jgi:4-hydroxy-3-polyprenylbenzoate decarboxylase|nr:UbiX family flavin prenyltransferase [Spirochaetaceae bacterium]